MRQLGCQWRWSLQSVRSPGWNLLQRFVDAKWGLSSPRHRKSLAEALTTVTCALTRPSGIVPSGDLQRRALMNWCFNFAARTGGSSSDDATPPVNLLEVVRWLVSNSISLEEAAKPAQLRLALNAIGRRLDGTQVSQSTLARKRSALHSALDHAVELELLGANPLARLTSPRRTHPDTVDRRVVVNPEQAEHFWLLSAKSTQR